MSTAAQICIGAGLTTLYYPIAYAKVLIQCGHEPLKPYLSTTLFGNHVYTYPNVFKYLGHIYRTDGFCGLYRGLGCKLIMYVISSSVTSSVQDELSGKPIYCKEFEEIDDDSEPENESFLKLLKETTCETISRCCGIIVSQPFYVISIRSMVQFVGRETRFSSLFSAIPDIWRNEGIMGYFSGLIPRIIAEALTIFIANFLAHVFNLLIVHIYQEPSSPFKTHSNMASQLIASQIAYPFSLMSVVMAVNGSGLAAGSPPLMPIYNSWLSCWHHLGKVKQTKRGSSLFWRRYYDPRAYVSGIFMPPVE